MATVHYPAIIERAEDGYSVFFRICRVARRRAERFRRRRWARRRPCLGTLMGLAERFGFTPRHELEAVVLDGGSGGLRNTAVPNFIYRWTEREVCKTVESARPEVSNAVRFFYGLRLPDQRLAMRLGFDPTRYRRVA